MSDKFNEKAQRVLNHTIIIASELGHTYIGSEHLLLALSGVRDSAATKLLESKGYFYRNIRDTLIALTGVGIRTTLTPANMTPRLKKIIERAYQTLSDTKATKIGTEHLLFALLEERDGMSSKILALLDANTGELKGELLAYMTGGKRIQSKKPYTRLTDIPTLSAYGQDLTAKAAEGELDPVLGREKETERLIQILLRRTKNNPCLIGEPGVGKTAVVEGLAIRVANGNIPSLLQGRTILSLDLSAMIAGAKYRGEFEERLKGVMAELKRYPSIILFIDEIHTIIGAGSAEGAVDAANILKPALSRGELQVIGATTIQEYRKHIEKDAALERRFQPLMIEEPDEDATFAILSGLKERYEIHHGVTITEEAIRDAIALSKRYIWDRYLPDKAIDLIDETAARIKLRDISMDNTGQKENDRLEQLKGAKEKAIACGDFATASYYREEELRLTSLQEHTTDSTSHFPIFVKPVVTAKDIRKTIEDWTGIIVGTGEAEGLRNDSLAERLRHHIIGQDTAVDTLARAIRRNEIGIRDPSRPIGCYLFVGPTGVGKTELCKRLSAELYGSDTAVIQLNMSEYQESHSISKLIGSPPGYVGFEEGGQLTERVRRRPYSLVVFDEIEKAHADIYNLLLQIMSEGILRDAQGRDVNFKNTIIILTSNIGTANADAGRPLGFLDDAKIQEKQTRENTLKAVRQHFLPELINRLDEVICFRRLNFEDAREITSLLVNALQNRLNALQIKIEASQAVLDRLTEMGYHPSYGARAIKRVITRELEDALAETLLENGWAPPLTLTALLQDGKIIFNKTEST